jgi:phosphotriesterase-related protein
MVWSVSGPVSAGDLGITSAHDHLTIDIAGGPRLKAFSLPADDTIIDEVTAFREAGGGTLVDLTNECMGRNVQRMKEIADSTGVTVIASTGYYTKPLSPAVTDVGALVRHFVDELQVGIDGTAIRAAVIGEIGTGAAMPGRWERLMFKAAALAHVETDAAIATHTFSGRYARWQLDQLTSYGVPAKRISIGHIDESFAADGSPLSIDLILEIADRGAYVAFDTVGNTLFSPFQERLEPSDHQRALAIVQLVDRGYEDHILLGQDVCHPLQLAANGGGGYAHIINSFVPMLRYLGLPMATIRRLMINNPRRWLSG